jgi:hypothetical protein
MPILLRFSFKEARKTAIFFGSLVAALWGPGKQIWDAFHVYADYGADWQRIIETHLLPVSAIIALWWDNMRQRDMFPRWFLAMDRDEAIATATVAHTNGSTPVPTPPEVA